MSVFMASSLPLCGPFLGLLPGERKRSRFYLYAGVTRLYASGGFSSIEGLLPRECAMRFDDEKRIDTLEGQMAAMLKQVVELRSMIDKFESSNKADLDHRFKIQSGNFDNVDKQIAEVTKKASGIEGELKKAMQRIAALEQQVKKLAK
jgi:hypothetical protein